MKSETMFDASGEDNKQKLNTDTRRRCPCISSVLVVEVQREKDLTYQDSKFHPPASSSQDPLHLFESMYLLLVHGDDFPASRVSFIPWGNP